MIITFLLGVILGGLSFMKAPCDKECRETLKKHKDIRNWLNSELKTATKRKLDKSIDPNKIKLLEIIIKKLEK